LILASFFAILAAIYQWCIRRMPLEDVLACDSGDNVQNPSLNWTYGDKEVKV